MLTATRASGPVVIDGVLDENAWAAAPPARGFIQSDPREGQPATFETEVRTLYNDDAIFFGVVATDPDPSKLIVTDLRKDYAVDASDAFSIILDTFHDGRNGYEFATNPAGAKWDAQVTNEGRDINANWDAIWDVRTRTTATGWVAEIWIPFRTLKFANADPQTWGINFRRKVRRLNEDSYWSQLPRIYGLERVSLAGTLAGMNGVRSGKNLRVKPYVLSSGSTVGRSGTNGDVQGGVDMKYGVTNGLVWDFTVNTDFSQVEADEQQVNLTRFSLFFPEKRDFFLENAGIFGFGSPDAIYYGGVGSGGVLFGGRQNATPDARLFFSRRIGLSAAGDALPILAGTRLTGREGAYSLGALNIQQREDGGVPASNFTALRMRRDVLANSDIGAVLLDKEETGPNFNRLAGVDANFRFGGLTLNGYVARTMSPVGTASVPGNALATRANVLYQDRRWLLRGRLDGIGSRFNDELGFVPRRGVNNEFTYISRTFRSQWFPSWLREVRPHWQTDTFTRQREGSLDSRQQDFHLPFFFSNGGFSEIGANTNVELTRATFALNSARGAFVPAGRHEYTEYFLTFGGNGAARLTPSLRYSIGRFYSGYRRSYAAGPSVHINEKLSASLNLQINNITLPTASYVSTLATTRINYNFNTKVFLTALLQYTTDTHQLSSNIRFNIIHRPLSDLFFVYNEHRDERIGLRQDRSIIAKLTYMLAL
jgi:uncharacterized protein DUF5916/cellulose/xylan binding protein with CBM9 domain